MWLKPIQKRKALPQRGGVKTKGVDSLVNVIMWHQDGERSFETSSAGIEESDPGFFVSPPIISSQVSLSSRGLCRTCRQPLERRWRMFWGKSAAPMSNCERIASPTWRIHAWAWWLKSECLIDFRCIHIENPIFISCCGILEAQREADRRLWGTVDRTAAGGSILPLLMPCPSWSGLLLVRRCRATHTIAVLIEKIQ